MNPMSIPLALAALLLLPPTPAYADPPDAGCVAAFTDITGQTKWRVQNRTWGSPEARVAGDRVSRDATRQVRTYQPCSDPTAGATVFYQRTAPDARWTVLSFSTWTSGTGSAPSAPPAPTCYLAEPTGPCLTPRAGR